MHYQQPTISSVQKVKAKPNIQASVHDESPMVAEFLDTASATLQEPFEQPNPDFLSSAEASNAATHTATNHNPQDQRSPTSSPSSSTRRSSMSDFSGFSFEPLPKPARYYAQTLSVPDKHALTTGEKNQNFKSWTPKDAVMHHEARKDLVPRVMPKADKTNALAGIEHDKQKSAQAFSRMTIKVRKMFKPRIKLTTNNGKKEEDEGEATYEQPHQQLASKSTTDLRSSSAPAPKLLATLPVSPHMVDEEMAPPRSSQHARAASSGDYFSHNPPGRVPGRRPVRHTRGHSPLASSSAPSSDTSNHRVRSPLTQEVPQHQHNPRVTFDAFLAPHKSGKGEAFHDTANAKKKPEGSPKSARSRLGRMSMPLLRRRGGLEEE